MTKIPPEENDWVQPSYFNFQQIKRLREKVFIDKVIKVCRNFYAKKKEELLENGKGKKEKRVTIFFYRKY